MPDHEVAIGKGKRQRDFATVDVQHGRREDGFLEIVRIPFQIGGSDRPSHRMRKEKGRSALKNLVNKGVQIIDQVCIIFNIHKKGVVHGSVGVSVFPLLQEGDPVSEL